MGSMTARLALPMIEAGQAQKEIVHNEALVLLDAAVQAAVEAVGPDQPPPAPIDGQAWIVGAAPVADWTGHAGQIAAWTAGGWRFLAPREGFAVWDRSRGSVVRRGSEGWRMAATATAPTGGATVDAEARAAIAQLVASLRAQGLLAA